MRKANLKIYDFDGNRITPCNALGEEICVMDAVKAQLEWHQEFGRAEFFRKIMIIETMIILVSVISMLWNCKFGSRIKK